MDSKKIDWLNHAIAFGASVIGIFIAFQLDDWQERRSRSEDVEVALAGIKAEVESNLAAYQKNDSILQQFFHYSDFFMKHLNEGTLLCSESDLDEARRINPERLSHLRLVARVSDTVSRYALIFNVDVVPFVEITTGNWEAAKSSGVLGYLDHERVALLSQVYEWTMKRVGVSDEEFTNYLIAEKEFEDVDRILRDYKLIMKASRVKHKNMKLYYDRIKW
jgi:hypothetical protein